MVELLLDKGADVKARTKRGESVLHLAIAGIFGLQAQVSPQVIALLVDKGADVNAADEKGITPLFLAALMPAPENGEFNPSEFAAATKGMNDSQKVLAAVRYRTRQLMEEARKAAAGEEAPAAAGKPAPENDRLLKLTEEIKEKLPAGSLEKLAEALMAPQWDKLELIQFLLSCGADPALHPKEAPDVLTMVVYGWNERGVPEGKVLRALRDGGAGLIGAPPDMPSPLAVAALGGNTAAINALLALGADPNLKMKEGVTALFVAVSEEQTEAARLLLQKGASPNMKTEEGWTPLLVAVAKENVPLARLLLQRGASATATGPKGLTPLEAARKTGNREMERLLKQAKK